MDGKSWLPVVLLASILGAMMMAAPDAHSAVVNGTFVYRDGAPASQRQLHFENRISHDMFIAPTSNDGAFSVDLPPGEYDLRAERGVILKSGIVVNDDHPVNVGQSVEPALLDPRRPFEHEGVGEDLVESEAPATANFHGRPVESMRFGHSLVQRFWGPAKPLPPIPSAAKSPAAESSPAASSAPAAN